MLRLLLFVSLLIPFTVLGQLTDAQLSTQLQQLIPNNTNQLITPASVRKVVQDGYDARISVYGNLGVKGLLGYNTLFTLTNDKQLVHKKYVDDKFAAIANAVQTFNGRDGTVVPLAGDYTFNMIGNKPTSISGYGIIPTFLDYSQYYYPLTGNPSGFISLAESRAGFSAPHPFFNYNPANGILGISYTPLDAALQNGKIYVGSSSDQAIQRTPSGDINMSNLGVFTLPNINANVGKFNNITLNEKGQAIAGENISYVLSIDKNATGNMGNSNVQVPTEFTIRNFVNSLGFYSGSAPVTSELDPNFTANGVFKNGSYPDPSFVASLSRSKIIGLIDPIQPDWGQTNTSALDFIKNKPAIPAGQVPSDWNSTSGPSKILNKPTIPAPQVPSDWNSTSGPSLILNKPIIPSPQIQSDWNQNNSSQYDFIKNKPAIPAAQVPTDWNSVSGPSRILNKPNFSTVALTGDFNDLLNKPTVTAPVNPDWNSTSGYSQILNKPTIPAAQQPADWNAGSGVTRIINKPNFGAVAFSNNYNDLLNRPSIPAPQVNSDWNSLSGSSQILNKPNLGIYELLANKSTSLATHNNSSYPTTQLLFDQLGLKQNTIAIPSNSLMGRYSTGTGTYQVITLSSDFSIVGGVLVSTGSTGGGNAPDTFQLVVSAPLYFTNGTPDILFGSDGRVLLSAEGDTLFGENTSTGRYLGIRPSSPTSRGTMSAYHNRKLDSLIAVTPAVTVEGDPRYQLFRDSIRSAALVLGTSAATPGRLMPISLGLQHLPTIPYSKTSGFGAGALWNNYGDIPGRATKVSDLIQDVSYLTTGDKGDITVNNVLNDWSIDQNTISSNEVIDNTIQPEDLHDVGSAGQGNLITFNAKGQETGRVMMPYLLDADLPDYLDPLYEISSAGGYIANDDGTPLGADNGSALLGDGGKFVGVNLATTEKPGIMSAIDKAKLDSLHVTPSIDAYTKSESNSLFAPLSSYHNSNWDNAASKTDLGDFTNIAQYLKLNNAPGSNGEIIKNVSGSFGTNSNFSDRNGILSYGLPNPFPYSLVHLHKNADGPAFLYLTNSNGGQNAQSAFAVGLDETSTANNVMSFSMLGAGMSAADTLVKAKTGILELVSESNLVISAFNSDIVFAAGNNGLSGPSARRNERMRLKENGVVNIEIFKKGFRGIVGFDENGNLIDTVYTGSGGGGTGTVTNFSAGDAAGLFTTTETNTSTTPTLNFSLNSQAANTVYRSSGGIPSFGQLVTADFANGIITLPKLSSQIQSYLVTSVTNFGTSGPATFNAGILNIPNYSTSGGTTSISLQNIGSTPNAKAATWDGANFTLQPGNEIYGGVLSTASEQNIVGNKHFYRNGTATSSVLSTNSWGTYYDGSWWNGSSVVNKSFAIYNNVQSNGLSEYKILGSAGDILAIENDGNYINFSSAATKIKAAGVDRITWGSGSTVAFPSLAIAGANKFVRADGFGTLTASNLSASDITTALSFTPANSSSAISWATPGVAGTAPNWLTSSSTLGSTATINIPMAATAGVTAGLISHADYISFQASGSTIHTTGDETKDGTLTRTKGTTGGLIESIESTNTRIEKWTKEYVTTNAADGYTPIFDQPRIQTEGGRHSSLIKYKFIAQRQDTGEMLVGESYIAFSQDGTSSSSGNTPVNTEIRRDSGMSGVLGYLDSTNPYFHLKGLAGVTIHWLITSEIMIVK